ncbi:MAG: Bpu10I family restriction endonuclease [Ktedonobacteraceae bacterium]
MTAYPTPHLEKLRAILDSDKLPPNDKVQVKRAIEYYEQWIKEMAIIMEANEPAAILLQKMVETLNTYRLHVDIDLIFDSQNDWLYREKGQIKLDNSVIEEFLPRLIHTCLKAEISQIGAEIGPVNAFSAIWFDSSLLKPEIGGGLNVRSKDQDFAISRSLYIKASNTPDFKQAVTKASHLAYVAAECKTNLDKTMFQEVCATAGDLKSAIPGAKYFLLCEWLDMPPISSDITPVDKVYILRKAKRINANRRRVFSTFKGRQATRESYTEFLSQHPISAEVFGMFIEEIRHLLKNESLDEHTALERGYF